MPRLISEFRAEHEGVQVKLISRSSAALRQLIMAQNFDIAVVEAPVPQPASNMEIFDYKCMCALPRDHPLNVKKVITPVDLNDVPITMLFADHSTHHQIRNAFSNAGTNLNVALECDFFLSACSFTRENGGVTIVDPITTSQIDSDELVLRPFEPTIKYQLVLTRPPNRAKSRLSDEFYQRLRNKLIELH
jgi:DNA-binding transcriptional LysR family regulator